MSLISALNIGRSALAAHQAALQVTSNNVANAGNPEYTRQSPHLSPNLQRPYGPSLFIGTGVTLDAIERQIDEALESRIRSSLSDSASAASREQWLGRVEAVFRELGDADLSSQLSAFFNSWSNLANQPQDIGLRQVVIQNGEALANSFKDIRSELSGLLSDANQRIRSLAADADSLAGQIADLNGRIASAEAGGGSALTLRDQRDVALKKLSEIMDVKVQDTGDGMVNVLLGSDPLVLGTNNRGVGYETETVDGQIIPKVFLKDDHGTLNINSGELGALAFLRGEISGAVDQTDSLAGNLIFELNKIHSSGQGLEGLSSATAINAVKDSNAALNTDAAGLAFSPVNGSFVVHVKQRGTGLTTSTLVQIDLDGLNGDDTTLASLQADLDAINGISASIVNGKLKIQADSDNLEFSFSQDSSGALASLGINSFFQGKNAADIAVNADLKARPSLLSAAKNGQAGDNQTARAIASLETMAIAGLSGASLKDSYQSMINGIAVSTASAKTASEGAQVVVETLTTQREALSGVSLDEEAVNLMREQRAFQGAARIITAVDELMRILLQMA